jgi:putative CocE/NonD family hydrolase
MKPPTTNPNRAGASGLIAFAVFGAVLCFPCSALDDKPKAAEKKSTPAALPASLAGFGDEGTFAIYKNEDRIATASFKWRGDGTFETTTVITLGGQSVTSTMKITPDKAGRWLKIELHSPAGPMTFERKDDVSRKTYKDKVETTKLKAGAVLFENFSPALLAQMVRAYDSARKGKQTIQVFVLPAIMSEGTLEWKDFIERGIGGKDVRFNRFTFSILGLDMELWADPDGKICLVDIPAQHVAMVREGYELLRKSPETDPLHSAPRHQVKIDRNVGVPMRDGIKLLTDIHRPDAPGKFPVILIRTPYKKEMTDLKGSFYARRGYVVAVQNCRGRFGSAGTWEPFVYEAKDGHDAVEWLAGQPWSSGKVGMIGGSYVGWVQWWAASEKPPHLVTIIPNVSPPDPFHNIPYEYGVFFLKGAIWWAEVLETEATGDLSGAKMRTIGEKKYDKLLRSLPVVDLDKKLLGKENVYWRKWIEHPTNDSYWEPADFLDRLQDVHIPVFHQSGWFDGDGIGTKLNYLRMASYGHPYQKLVLGPWGHTDEAQRRYGERDFGADAIIDLPRAYLRWFDYWLKGTANGIAAEPLVSIFVIGANKWLHGKTYPLENTRFEKWHLASAGKANTSKGDGRLTTDTPLANSVVDRYTYDPADPTPDPDTYEEPEDPSRKEKSSEETKRIAEAYHQQTTDARNDILVYASEPFKQPYAFAGPISGVLYAATSGRDTDWFMRLMEVDKAGKIFQLAEGKIRARFRHSTKQPEMLEPGKIYEYRLDLWQMGISIPAGHRLRVEIASASFPSYSRNLNTGGHNEMDTQFQKAKQTVYHSKEHPSHVLLPVVELKSP